MRSLPASVTAGFATDSQALARCVKIDLRDGTVLAFTDHDEDLVVDLNDNSYNVIYRADDGLFSGDLELAVGLDSSNTEFTVPLGSTVSRTSAIGRRYNQATVWIFDVDWTQDNPEPIGLMKGWIAETWVRQNRAVFEVRSFADYFNIVQGRILSPRCSADFGDAQCGVTQADVPATVTVRISNMKFAVDLAGTLEDGHFKFGECEFLTGQLGDVAPTEVFDYIGSSGIVEVLAPLPAIPQVGDTLVLRQGCSKLKSSTDPTIPTCLSHANVLRFRGFDRVPGSDTFLKMPIPGEG